MTKGTNFLLDTSPILGSFGSLHFLTEEMDQLNLCDVDKILNVKKLFGLLNFGNINFVKI